MPSWALGVRGKQGQEAGQAGPAMLQSPGLLPPRQDKVGQGTHKLEHTRKVPHPLPPTNTAKAVGQHFREQLATGPAGPSEGVAVLGLHGVVNQEQEGSKHHKEDQLAPEWDLAVLAQPSPRGLLFWPDGSAGEPRGGGR